MRKTEIYTQLELEKNLNTPKFPSERMLTSQDEKNAYTWYETEQMAWEKKTYYRWKHEAGFLTASHDVGRRKSSLVSLWNRTLTVYGRSLNISIQ